MSNSGSPAPVLIEACVDSIHSAIAAARGGAGRLELCADLADGGTTPSAGTMAAVKACVAIPVFVIIRPRGGGFVYTEREVDIMRRDIEVARNLGADGLVIGALSPDARVDIERTRACVECAGSVPVTFHRAFDLTRDLEEALETLVHIGVTRVLTSGGAPTALSGVDRIASLVRLAERNRGIQMVAGGGIAEDTVAEIVQRSGVREVHVRGTVLRQTEMAPARPSVRFRKALPENEGSWEETDADRIRTIVARAGGHAGYTS